MLWKMNFMRHSGVGRDRYSYRAADDIESVGGGFKDQEKEVQTSTATSREAGLDWMAFVDDETPLSNLTIPGTHDSAAYTKSWPFVATQRMNILDQLNAGIRYFDLRCGILDDVVQMVHGPTLLDITLRTVLETMYTWLGAHSTEGLVVQIKRDRKDSGSTLDFPQAIFNLIQTQSDRWRTSNTVPTMGAIRGRIQLFRRFGGTTVQAYGLNVTEWQDNPDKPFTIVTRNGVQITIQDHYTFLNPESLPSLIAKKGADISELLQRAAADLNPCHWYLNFTSAYELNIYYQLPPRAIAVGGWWGFRWEEGINVRLRGYLREHGGSQMRYGIVAMDFPEIGTDGLIDTLIQTNFEPAKNGFWKRLIAWLQAIVLLMMLLAPLWCCPECLGVSISWKWRPIP